MTTPEWCPAPFIYYEHEMKTLLMTIEVNYDEALWHGDDAEARQAIFNELLKPTEGWSLHSNLYGDSFGDVRVLECREKGNDDAAPAKLDGR